MTQLTKIIKNHISEKGPITIAEYMQYCLAHPKYGYYQNQDPIGKSGDFITAPEISQMFGEILGLWLMQVWSDQGRPNKFILAELGPGRGTLMSDIMRTAKLMPEFASGAEIWLVETSPKLQETQKSKLSSYSVNWATDIDQLPQDLPLFLVANEFFDALPIQQFRPTENGWQERLVTLENSKLKFSYARPQQNPHLDEMFPMLSENRVVEVCKLAQNIVSVVARHIEQYGGGALVIDYGSQDGTGDTLQALQQHKFVDSLHSNHGEADLTAHVHFGALKKSTSKTAAFGPVRQGDFLHQLGIGTRAHALINGADQKTIETVSNAYNCLTHPDEMGSLFKVMGIVPKTAPKPPGFDDEHTSNN